MATHQMNEVVQSLRRTVLRDGAGMMDRELLEAFVRHRDVAALADLVRRHGPMVWGVCRRILSHQQDAEDAFQATFLVFVRKAAAIQHKELVGNWLHGVAHHTAIKARTVTARKRVRERQVADMPEPAVAEQELSNDVSPLIDQELSNLPDKYRILLVLCDLEGKTRKEAAQQLGCPEGTVAGRLARARTMLAKRLARRGVAISGGALAAILSQSAASACVPPPIVSLTITAASKLAAGQAVTAVASPAVAALTEGVLKVMMVAKLKVAMAVFLVLGILGTGSSVLIGETGAAPVSAVLAQQDVTKPKEDKPKEEPKDKKPEDPTKKPPEAPAQKADKFHTIVLGGSGNAVVRQTGKEMVTPANPLTGEPRIEDGVLHLEGSSDFEIEVKELKGVRITGSGNVEVQDLKGKKLEVNISGSGNVTPTGTLEEAEVVISGSGTFKGADVKGGKRATVRVSGSGSVVVNASERVVAEVSGSGTVEYIGSPQVEQSVTGSGEVRKFTPKEKTDK